MAPSNIKPKRILVMRLGAIGDCLRVLPAVQRIRREIPDAHIGWAVEHWVKPVLDGNPLINQFHVLDRKAMKGGAGRAWAELRRTADEIGAENYDVLIDFHGRFKSGLLSWLSGVPVRVGFARGDGTEGNSLFMNRHVKLGDHWENRVHRFLHLLEPLGLPVDYDAHALGLYVNEQACEKARAWYASIGNPPIAAYPGTSLHRIDERWPAEKWVELLRALDQRGIRAVLFWGPAEEEFTRDIAQRAGNALVAPRTTLPEMMAMIGLFRAFAGSDTGAMHMAWMQQVPTAVLMGPKPLRTAAPPPPAATRLLRAEEYYVEGLPPGRQSAELVHAVPVDDMLKAIEELLAERTSA